MGPTPDADPTCGDHLTLGTGRVRATICTRGAALVELVVDGHAAIPPPAGAACPAAEYRGVVLAPWPNRTEASYTADGRTLQLEVDEPVTGAALHGLVAHHRWDVVETGPVRAVLQTLLGEDPGYPWRVQLRASYTVEDDGIAAVVVAEHIGPGHAPVGLGAHPYLSAGVPPDDSELQLPADQVLELDPRGTPVAAHPVGRTALDFRTRRPIGALRLDHAFSRLRADPDGAHRISLDGDGRRVVVEAGTTTRCVMVYTSDTLPPPARRTAVAIEPMTCPPGALASGDVATLGEGDRLELRYAVRVPAG